jgi:hypothetical protein
VSWFGKYIVSLFLNTEKIQGKKIFSLWYNKNCEKESQTDISRFRNDASRVFFFFFPLFFSSENWNVFLSYQVVFWKTWKKLAT